MTAEPVETFFMVFVELNRPNLQTTVMQRENGTKFDFTPQGLIGRKKADSCGILDIFENLEV